MYRRWRDSEKSLKVKLGRRNKVDGGVRIDEREPLALKRSHTERSVGIATKSTGARTTKFYDKAFGLELTAMEIPGMVAAMFPMAPVSGKANVTYLLNTRAPMRTDLIEKAVCAAVTVAFAYSTSVSAQAKGERSSPARREECSQIEQQVNAGSRDHLLLASLQGCDDTGPRVLVDKWRDLPTEYTMLYALMRSSSILRDRRLLVYLTGLATDFSKPVLHRTAAIVSMVSYINPSYVPYLAKDSRTAGGLYAGVGMTSHINFTEGAEPLAPSDLATLRQALTVLATRDTSKSVRELARRVVDTPVP